MTDRVPIERLKTGVAGLDEILGGGIPEFSLNLVAGTPGSGKTTLAHQIMFNLATADRPAIFFTVLGEPPLKMLRYQQQYDFFDFEKIDRCVHFVNLAAEMAQGDFAAVLARIGREVAARGAGLVLVDSFRSVVQAGSPPTTQRSSLQHFVQDLAMQLTSCQATTFLIGEYNAIEGDGNPVFTIADGILWLSQTIDRNSAVRKIQASKMRGLSPLPGLHTFRIDDAGVHVFPRKPTRQAGAMLPRLRSTVTERLSVGNAQVDKMLGGGLPQGYSLLVTGPSGSGKTVLATAFLAEGARLGEVGILAVFETNPGRLRSAALDVLVENGGVTVFDTRNLDLSVDETLHTLTELVYRTGARRVVIDSLSGFELALAPSFRQDFRESLFRMVSSLMDLQTTVLLTCELEDRYGDLRFSPYGAAFLTDAIIMQRYIEIDGHLRRALAVVKVRDSDHASSLHFYDINADGIVMAASLQGYQGVLTGIPIARMGNDDPPRAV